MADTFLPADVRRRIIDVMRERKMTQRELALRIDVNESTISRFQSAEPGADSHCQRNPRGNPYGSAND